MIFFIRRLRQQRRCYFGAVLAAFGAADQHPCKCFECRETRMSLIQRNIESLPFVQAELNYLAPVSGKPRTYAFDPPPGEPRSTNLPEPHRVPIFDGRAIANTFALVRHPTAVKDFYDEAQIKSIYYPAAEAFLRATLKADRVFLFDHTVRRR